MLQSFNMGRFHFTLKLEGPSVAQPKAQPQPWAKEFVPMVSYGYLSKTYSLIMLKAQ